MPQITLFEHQKIDAAELGIKEPDSYFNLLESLNTTAGDTLVTIGRNYLKATQYVGVLQVKDLTIQILPKVDFDPSGHVEAELGSLARKKAENSALSNLLHMLAYANNLTLHKESSANLDAIRDNWFEILTRFFALELHQQFLHGPHWSYQRREEVLPVMRGKWLIGRHLNTRPHERHRFDVAYDEFTVNNQLNQIFRYTVEALLRLTHDATNQRLLRAIYTWLSDVSSPSVIVEAQLEEIFFDRLNQRYQVAFNYARMFLSKEAMLLAHGRRELFAFVFDMNILYERFVAGFFERFKPLIFSSYETLPQIKPQSKGYVVHLLRRESDEKLLMRLRPDLLVTDIYGRVMVILDTKYKQISSADSIIRVAESDVYQMVAYMKGFKSTQAVLLYPTEMNQPPIINRFTISDGRQTIHFASINLHQPLSDPKPLIQDLASMFEYFSFPAFQEVA